MLLLSTAPREKDDKRSCCQGGFRVNPLPVAATEQSFGVGESPVGLAPRIREQPRLFCPAAGLQRRPGHYCQLPSLEENWVRKRAGRSKMRSQKPTPGKTQPTAPKTATHSRQGQPPPPFPGLVGRPGRPPLAERSFGGRGLWAAYAQWEAKSPLPAAPGT